MKQISRIYQETEGDADDDGGDNGDSRQRSRSLRWPAKDWVMTVSENMAIRVKMEGPAMSHVFFDSNQIRLIKFPPFDSCSSISTSTSSSAEGDEINSDWWLSSANPMAFG